jgi:hypothetical protein
MQPLTLEGTWEEISRRGADLAGKRVRVTVLATADATTAGKRLSLGMFPGFRDLTDADFALAEYRGGPDEADEA